MTCGWGWLRGKDSLRGLGVGILAMSLGGGFAGAQEARQSTPGEVTKVEGQAAAEAAVASGGTVRGTVKAGAVPLPGVAVTATNTLTGKKYSTTTDVLGAFAMAIPRDGRYVVRTELAAFASETKEVLLNAAGANGGAPEQVVDFGMQLASRVARKEAAETAAGHAGAVCRR